MGTGEPTGPIGAEYVDFAVRNARGVSATYERLAFAVSRDDVILALLTELPPAKRQPDRGQSTQRQKGCPAGSRKTRNVVPG